MLWAEYLKSLFFGLSMHWPESGPEDHAHMPLRRLFVIRQNVFSNKVALFARKGDY